MTRYRIALEVNGLVSPQCAACGHGTAVEEAAEVEVRVEEVGVGEGVEELPVGEGSSSSGASKGASGGVAGEEVLAVHGPVEKVAVEEGVSSRGVKRSIGKTRWRRGCLKPGSGYRNNFASIAS